MVLMTGLMPVAGALAQTVIPRLVSGINDPEHVLRPQQTADLSKKLAAFEQGKDIAFVILIVRDIGRANLIEYSDRALATWAPAPGSKGRVILLTVIADRERAWIEERLTGLELSTAQRIIFETIVPRLKTGHDIAGGIDAGLDQLASVLSGNPLPPPPDPTGALHSLTDRLDDFRYRWQGTAESAHLLEAFYFGFGVALGLGVRRYIGRWAAGLLAAALAGFGSWLQYGFIVPYAAGAFVIVVFGWQHWFGKGSRASNE